MLAGQWPHARPRRWHRSSYSNQDFFGVVLAYHPDDGLQRLAEFEPTAALVMRLLADSAGLRPEHCTDHASLTTRKIDVHTLTRPVRDLVTDARPAAPIVIRPAPPAHDSEEEFTMADIRQIVLAAEAGPNVRQAYLDVLDREPDPPGDVWLTSVWNDTPGDRNAKQAKIRAELEYAKANGAR